MSDVDYKKISHDGLWKNNVALVQLLGLCPLLAVTNTATNGLGLGLATLATLILSNGIISGIKDFVRAEIRLPVFVLIIASVVTLIELLMKAWFFDLYLILGVFIPLIVTNCSIIGRAESFASKNAILPSITDGFMMGIGFLSVLVILGGAREMIGSGTIFNNIDLMLGESTKFLTFTINDSYQGFLMAVLPPGAFIGLGLLIVLKNLYDQRMKEKQQAISISAKSISETS
ncbi:MAG: electron transport complex subunit E [Gammaproteobacteria bacterium]|nr:electron transport complex subunit E [Gammaproteobacteria bacterium]